MKDFVSRPFHRGVTKAISTKAISREEGDQPRGAAGREEVKAGLQSLVPVWNAVRRETSPQNHLAESTKIVLLGGDQRQLDWVQRCYPSAQLESLVGTLSVDSVAKALGDCCFDQLLWIAPDVDGESGGDEPIVEQPIIEQQEAGVLAVFRMIKALLQLGYGNKKLQWTLVTSKTQRVKEDDQIQPAHAGISGLVGSLAKEYPQWEVRLLDLESLACVSARECLSLPWDKQGNGLGHRQGEWFQPGVALLESLPQGAPVYRQNGVYVVIGGAGGLGEVWSRYMMEKYQANVVWIGRRAYDAAIEEKMTNSLIRLGSAPLYISADARDLDALEQANKTILKTYPAIHGVVHSALVLQDQSLGRMDEAGFRASFSAKVDVSVNMDRVFGKQALDFMLFFSSLVSFLKPPGQSNYSAGCTFKDSFAHQLQQRRAYLVKIMNWGYWGNVGVAADEFHRKTMEQMGMGSIEPEEGMASLQALVNSEMHQAALIKTLHSNALAMLNLSETIAYYPRIAPAILPQVQRALAEQVSTKSTIGLEAELPTQEMNDLVTEILAASLTSLDLFRNGIHRIADLSLERQPAPYYDRWLSSSTRHLQQQRVLSADLTFNHEVRELPELWAEWEAKTSAWVTKPSLQAQIALFTACLKALPGILSGKQLATEVMFPNSSMRLVEGIYRDNALADHFNQVLGETLIACIEHQLQADRDRKIRILEIGAGTGGTTAKLLPRLHRFPIEEYCYTDVSKAFLMYAEKHYQPTLPALTTAIFDVSKPLASQLIAADHYDFAIAANVLHATPNIRETLRNAKAALKNQGVLLLNEISNWSLFNHLTFGLLEGWWLHQDTAVRLAGSPGLAPEKWREILAEEGFESTFFPAQETHKCGQQIIAASSNGLARQRVEKSMAPQPSADPKRTDARPRAVASSEKAKGASLSAEVTEPMSNEYIRRIVIEKLSDALNMDAAKIRNDAPFADYGVDSIIGVNLVHTINETLGIELETTTLFEYSTVEDLTQYVVKNWQQEIAGRLAQGQGQGISEGLNQPADDSRAEFAMSSEHRFTRNDLLGEAGNASNAGQEGSSRNITLDPIAIIGMSGRFAESESLDEFWRNLKEGKNLVKKVSRWSETECVISEPAGHGYCSSGSFIGSIDRFDPMFFGISSQEAAYMDPQQRLFLEESWRALEDAGYAAKSVPEKQCGVYVGCGKSNYDSLFTEEPPPQAFWGNSESVIPARIAYYLNLQGPTIAIDTACSSSLVAIHLACQSLWARETEMALAGGVFLQPTPAFYQVANRAGMLSPAGKCYSFDARANGFVPGEGVGVVVLKRLQDALRDGDHIHGVIAGSGINQNGSSNGLIAPNARAQERLERSVYDRFKINPETIQVVEAHGTGTLLGDSIEYGAINRSFREYTDKKQFCAFGSVKTNIGHAATAAGIAGILKLLLSLKHRQIPPSLHFEKSNPAIDFESGPFYVNAELKEWKVEDKGIRRSAISSFGFSGSNAHLVIEDAPSSVERAAVELPGYLVVLSARTAEQLRQQVINLLGLAKRTPALSMNDLSFTLFVGRSHLSHRLSCVARSQQELIHLLEQWVETRSSSQIYTSEIREGATREQATLKRFGNYCIQECRNSTSAAAYLEYLATVADLYLQGYSLDFQALFAETSRRMPLPTYPFAQERYWIDAVPTSTPRSAAAKSAAPRPLRRTNNSIPRQQSYNSGLAGVGEDLVAHLLNDLSQMAGEILKLDAGNISLSSVLMDMGFDSIGLTTLAKAINQKFQLDITPIVFFDYPSVGEIAKYLAVERESEIRRFYRRSARRRLEAAEPELAKRNPY